MGGNSMHLTVSKIQLKEEMYELGYTDKGVAYFGRLTEHAELALFFPFAEIRESSQTPEIYAQPLTAYFNGEPVAFSFPFDFIGTPFQQTVWQALTEVPYGTTVSYSELAARVHRPTAVRAVANAVGRNPMMIIVPCHRVLGKNGRLTGYRGGLAVKRQLLQLEGIPFKE
jgi:methylated-DNA-[protein]-cysteine S-methyltransferase